MHIYVYVLYTVEVQTYRVLVKPEFECCDLSRIFSDLKKCPNEAIIRRKPHIGWLIIVIPHLLDTYGYFGVFNPQWPWTRLDKIPRCVVLMEERC